MQHTEILHNLYSELSEELKQVDSIIKESINVNIVWLIEEISSHLIFSGGKKLRPLLTLASSKAVIQKCTYNSFLLAAAVECIHSATLLHDDVIDNGTVRRGRRAAHLIWGILVGDYLFSQAFRLMVRTDSIDSLKALSDASSIISKGEVYQLQLIGDLNVGVNTYIELITAKTAELFGAACKVGAIGGSSDIVHSKALYSYGINLGICFQIIDDILDYTATELVLGKAPGTDLREKKITLPIILLLEQLKKSEKDKVKSIFDNISFSDNDLFVINELLAQYKINEAIFKLCKEYTEMGIIALSNIPDSDMKKQLRELASSLVDRQF